MLAALFGSPQAQSLQQWQENSTKVDTGTARYRWKPEDNGLVDLKANFWITTSGNFRTQTLIDAILEIGADHILFSTDWPFENIDHAAIWFDAASISESDRIKIGRTNCVDLFKLKL